MAANMSIILYQDFDGVNKKCEPLMPTLLRGHGKQDDDAKGVKGGCLTMRNKKGHSTRVEAALPRGNEK